MLCLLCGFALAGTYPNQRGFGLAMGVYGSGINFNYTWNPSLDWAFGLESRIYDIKDEDEIPIVTYNYYGQPVQPSDITHLVILPVLLTARYYPFEGQIANNIRPFISTKAGPVFVMEATDEESFFKRWSHPDIATLPGGYFGGGMDIGYINRIVFTASAGFDIFPMKNNAGKRANYSGLVLGFTLNWRK
ncbi:MAG: hypothetical protein HN647_06425 [Candidatus Marinimicrobia bacterium]|jgi:hypothetical protein|nr:hypothetical protein [Candidatus Neomarinimicrobiota bacterium]MBT6000218.1 hypothetical protein [Candidatus Neomarinimicrobiota bacterium]MBT7986195.1 hypothetical protein [Candidatus Neomarinimicrobiota bacterium]